MAFRVVFIVFIYHPRHQKTCMPLLILYTAGTARFIFDLKIGVMLSNLIWFSYLFLERDFRVSFFLLFQICEVVLIWLWRSWKFIFCFITVIHCRFILLLISSCCICFFVLFFVLLRFSPKKVHGGAGPWRGLN